MSDILKLFGLKDARIHLNLVIDIVDDATSDPVIIDPSPEPQPEPEPEPPTIDPLPPAVFVLDAINKVYRTADNENATLGDMGYTRNGNPGALMNGSGIWETGPVGPRIGHHILDGETFVEAGILLGHTPRTSRTTHTGMDISGNTPVNATIGAAVNTPLGAGTGVTLIEDSTTNTHRIAGGALPEADATHVVWGYAKAGTRYHVTVRSEGAGGRRATVSFDLTDGSVRQTYISGWVFMTQGTVYAGNGWWLWYIITNYDADAQPYEYMVDNGAPWESLSVGPRYAGDGTSGVLVSPMQCCTVDSATRFPFEAMPDLSGSALTRGAESFTLPANNIGFSQNGVWGVMSGHVSYHDGGAAAQQTLFDWTADVDNYIRVTLDTDGSRVGAIKLAVCKDGAVTRVSGAYLSPGPMESFNIAWRASNVDGNTQINLALGGVPAAAVELSGGLPDLSQADAVIAYTGILSTLRLGTGAVTDANIQGAFA